MTAAHDRVLFLTYLDTSRWKGCPHPHPRPRLPWSSPQQDPRRLDNCTTMHAGTDTFQPHDPSTLSASTSKNIRHVNPVTSPSLQEGFSDTADRSLVTERNGIPSSRYPKASPFARLMQRNIEARADKPNSYTLGSRLQNNTCKPQSASSTVFLPLPYLLAWLDPRRPPPSPGITTPTWHFDNLDINC